MSLNPILYGKIKDGVWSWDNDDKAVKFFSGLSDGKYRVIVEKDIKKRTDSQNRFYWLYLDIISKELSGGETPANYYHEFFKRVFLKPRIISVMGKEIKIPASTTDLNKVEFGVYISQIEIKTGVQAPDIENYITL